MEYLVVDVDNRKIIIPESITHLGVKDDNETRTLNFRMPKIYKGLDMSDYTIEINYINAKGKADSALAGNIQVGDEEITFQWCAGGTAYAKDGKVRFLVYTYLENEDLTKTNEWHTTWARLEVLEGGNVDEQIAKENPRIIEEMLRRIRDLENGETGGEVVIDDTLTEEGQAADAKATGDKLTRIEQEINENTKEELLSENEAKTFIVGTDIQAGDTLIFVTPFDEATGTGKGSVTGEDTHGGMIALDFPIYDIAVGETPPETTETSIKIMESYASITVDEYVTVYKEVLTARGELEKKIEEANGSTDAVQYIEQELTDEQKAQARTNISAASAEDVRQVQEQIADKAILENGVIKFYKSGETDKELFTVDISSVGGSGGLDLNNLTLSVSQVGEYQRLSMSDGTTTKTVDIPITAISDEQVQTAVQIWLDEHPEATTTIEDGSVTMEKLHGDVSAKIKNAEVKLFGGEQTLPLVITEENKRINISGDYVFACPNDNLFYTASPLDNKFDVDTMTFLSNVSGKQFYIPLSSDMLSKVLYVRRKVLKTVGTESNNTITIIESTGSKYNSLGTQTTIASGIGWNKDIDLSQYTFTEGKYYWLILTSANVSVAGNMVGMYVGLTKPTHLIDGEYNGDGSELDGYTLYATEGTTAYINSLEEDIDIELKPLFDMEEIVNGDYKTLPTIITEELKEYEVRGKYVFACPQNNLIDGATANGNRFDINTMTFITSSSGRQIFVPLDKELIGKTIYATRKILKQVGIESKVTISIGETSSESVPTYGYTNTLASGIEVENKIAEIDLSQYTFTEGYYYWLTFVSANNSYKGNIVGMYVGEEYPDNIVAGEYYGKGNDFLGYKVYATERTEICVDGIKEALTVNMPSKKSMLIVNDFAELEKMEKPFSFINKNQYLDNGENGYFCWNHNKLHYDNTIHRFIYICKNKSTHTSSGDGNVYMYKIDPSNPTEATPQKIYVGENQIGWLQGFAILEDGTWLLADCNVKTYDKPQMIVSRDNGTTFEILCEFLPPISGGYFNSISKGFNGRIFGAYDDGTVKTSSANSHIAYSDDNGVTWNDIEITSQKFVEQLILPISETRLALIGRYNAYGGSEQKAVTAYSDDNGLTWTFFNSSIKMHCNDCAGFVHNGLIELFALERYYTNSFRVGDKMGQLTHYIGDAEDFVKDNMIEYEVHYLSAYESGDLGHPSACIDEYGNALVITSANHDRVKNNTYPLMLFSDNNRNPV